MNVLKNLFWGDEDEKKNDYGDEMVDDDPTNETKLTISTTSGEDFEEVSGLAYLGDLSIDYSDYIGVSLTLREFYKAIRLKECYQLYDGDRPIFNELLPLASLAGRTQLQFRKIRPDVVSTSTLWKLWGEVKAMTALPRKRHNELEDMIRLISELMELEKQYGVLHIIKDATDIRRRLNYLKYKYSIHQDRHIVSSFRDNVRDLKTRHSPRRERVYACECCKNVTRPKYTRPIDDITRVGYEVPIRQSVTNEVLFEILDHYLQTHTTPISFQ